jgi:hypothetical protein
MADAIVDREEGQALRGTRLSAELAISRDPYWQSADHRTCNQPKTRIIIGHAKPLSFFHFRDRDDFEVDIVMERGAGGVAGVEVKAAATATERDFCGLRKLRELAGPRFSHGVVLYDGEACIRFGPDFHAVPVRALWETD